MAKKKDAEGAETAAPPAEKITQRVAVERALAAGKADPTEGVAYVKEQFDITLNNGGFSTIKSQIKKAAGESKPRAKPGRPKGGINPVGISHPVKASNNGVPNVATSIESLKVLCDQLGVDQVVAIAHLFRK
jgi:hypothetical protein